MLLQNLASCAFLSVFLWSLIVVCELSMSAICMQGWFHCRGEERPDALIGAGVARQQMSSRLGGGLPVEEYERERERKRERKVEVENDGERGCHIIDIYSVQRDTVKNRTDLT